MNSKNTTKEFLMWALEKMKALNSDTIGFLCEFKDENVRFSLTLIGPEPKEKQAGEAKWN